MRAELNATEFHDLPTDLQLKLSGGQIQLENDRLVLTHAKAVGALRRELIEVLGQKATRAMLMRMGFISGVQDAELARRLAPYASDLELLKIGPALHTLEGVAKVSPVRMLIDVASAHFEFEAFWDDSYEAATHIGIHGLAGEPVCWTMQGYASGYASTLTGKLVVFRELDCKGKGDDRCRVVGRLVRDWGESIGDIVNVLNADLVPTRQYISTAGSKRDDSDEAKPLLLGQSKNYLKAYKMLQQAAAGASTVLLLGETGVGKTMFARQLHRWSARATGPFVSINCGAIPETLIEAELFGVERGAYTGADRSRAGRFERADKGTLFLDEVGDLPLQAQVKLLRVLEDGEFERVGDGRTRKCDVRIVAATNQDLREKIRSSQFRADLYYRLNVFPILIPPLRERKEDIPQLAWHMLTRVARRLEKRISGISEAAISKLLDYSWPGNIRELENIIERSIVSTEEDCSLEGVSIELSTESVAGRDPYLEPNAREVLIRQLLQSKFHIADVEADLLKAAVMQSSGNLSRAARMVGMTRRQLAYRLKRISSQ
jgi:two-component system response regulator HydG